MKQEGLARSNQRATQSSIYQLNPRHWLLKSENSDGDLYVNRANIPVLVRYCKGEPEVPPEFRTRTMVEYYDKQINPRSVFGLLKQGTGSRCLDVQLCLISNIKCFYTVVAMPQSERGYAFLATLTIPFKYSSVEVSCKIAERNSPGYREKLVAMVHGARADALAKEFDAEFADHPLTRVRKTILQIVDDLTINSLNRPTFYD